MNARTVVCERRACRHAAVVVVRDAMYALVGYGCFPNAVGLADKSETGPDLPLRLSWIDCRECRGEGRLATGIRCVRCDAAFRALIDRGVGKPLYNRRAKA